MWVFRGHRIPVGLRMGYFQAVLTAWDISEGRQDTCPTYGSPLVMVGKKKKKEKTLFDSCMA